MTPRAKQTLRNYINDVGGIGSFPKGKRLTYLKAWIRMLNSWELSGCYDKMESFYDFTISDKPLMPIK
jgi:hypothetical protein